MGGFRSPLGRREGDLLITKFPHETWGHTPQPRKVLEEVERWATDRLNYRLISNRGWISANVAKQPYYLARTD